MKQTHIDLKTGAVTVQDDPSWTPPPITAGDVKAEARRRILAFAPEWKQLNAIREGDSELFAKLDAIRAASDAIEAMDPIPDDYRDDKHWPE